MAALVYCRLRGVHCNPITDVRVSRVRDYSEIKMCYNIITTQYNKKCPLCFCVFSAFIIVQTLKSTKGCIQILSTSDRKFHKHGDETGSLPPHNKPHQTSPPFLSFSLILFHPSVLPSPLSSPTMPFVLGTPIYHGVKVERDIIMGCRAGERRQG